MAAIEERTLLDGGQTAEGRLPGAVGDAVADAIRAATARGVAVRIAYNVDHERPTKPFPPPPRTEPSLLEALGVPLRPIPATQTSCITSTRCATAPPCGRARRRASHARTRVTPTTCGAGGASRAAVHSTLPRSTSMASAFARGSPPGAGLSCRTASPSGSGRRGGGCASHRRC